MRTKKAKIKKERKKEKMNLKNESYVSNVI